MSSRSWISSLRQALRSPAERATKIAIVGVGNELRGDDGAGPAVVQALRAMSHIHQSSSEAQSASQQILILDAGPAPENYTGPLRRFRPAFVLIIDAAEMGEAPGTVRWLSWKETSGIGVATHALPLHVFATYLCAGLDCDVALLGIQPANTEIGAAHSASVQKAVRKVIRVLASELDKHIGLTTDEQGEHDDKSQHSAIRTGLHCGHREEDGPGDSVGWLSKRQKSKTPGRGFV